MHGKTSHTRELTANINCFGKHWNCSNYSKQKRSGIVFVAFAKTLIIVKIASRINNILTHFWKSKILLKFQKLCSLWLMRACQTLKQILNKMLTRIMILQNFSEMHRISKLRVETANSIQITTTIDVTTIMGSRDSTDLKNLLQPSKDEEWDSTKPMKPQAILISKPRLPRIQISSLHQLLETLTLRSSDSK